MKVWAPTSRIYIHGSWEKIYEHFSVAAEAHYLWASVDIQAEINSMRTNGTIEVKITMDSAVFGADAAAASRMEEQLTKRTDLVLNMFMEQAKKAIFEIPQPKVDPAHADSGGGLFGFALAAKYRRDEHHLDLHYDETREQSFVQMAPISGTLSGFVDEIKNNPEMEKHYFSTLFLDDWERKVTRTIKPVVNWPLASQGGQGDPVAFISVQVGYPDIKGQLQWSGHMFQASDPIDAVFQPAMAKKDLSDVTDPPADWKPDTTYIKRKIHCTEPPNDTRFMIRRVEAQEVELDPGPNGTPTNDINLEVRADSAGKLDLSLMIDKSLTDATQIVEVTIQPDGKTRDGVDRAPARFQWSVNDQLTPRNLYIFTGQLDYIPTYKYQVRVIIKGSLFTKGMEWSGPWEDSKGNGELMLRVPTPEDEGVTVKRYIHPAIGALPAPMVPGALPVTTGAIGAPPAAAGAPGMPPPTRAPARAIEREVQGYRTIPAGGAAAPASARGLDPAAPVHGWSTDDPASAGKSLLHQE